MENVAKEHKQNEVGYKVEVRGARNLVPKDPNRASDPYCLLGVADPNSFSFLDTKRSKVCTILSYCSFLYYLFYFYVIIKS